jgi:hypothetical protein
MGQFNKAVGHKVTILKTSSIFIYSNGQLKTENFKTVQITTAPKIISYIGRNLTKYVQELHDKTTTLMKSKT